MAWDAWWPVSLESHCRITKAVKWRQYVCSPGPAPSPEMEFAVDFSFPRPLPLHNYLSKAKLRGLGGSLSQSYIILDVTCHRGRSQAFVLVHGAFSEARRTEIRGQGIEQGGVWEKGQRTASPPGTGVWVSKGLGTEQVHFGCTKSPKTRLCRKYPLVPVSRFNSVFGVLPILDSLPPDHAVLLATQHK